MIESPWICLAIGAGTASACMTALWVVQVRTRDATQVDIGWAYEIGIVSVLYAILATGADCHRILVGVLAGIWSLRLGTYLVLDRMRGHGGEDGRYRELRRRWTERGLNVDRRFFVFFQAQALFVVWFTVPMLLAVYNPSSGIEPLEIVGICLWAIGIVCNVTADRQLRRWRHGSGQPRQDLPSRPLALLAAPELLLRVGALDRLGVHLVRRAVGVARLDDTRVPAPPPLHRHGHPADRGAGPPLPRRRLPPLPGRDVDLRALVPEEVRSR